MYGFEIVSTIEISDHNDRIKVGDVLYKADLDDLRHDKISAMEWGKEMLNGLDGGRAMNEALESAEIRAFEVPDV